MKNLLRWRKKEKSQSLLELAIFGAVFLVFFGLLLTLGLKSNFTQQSLQQTFRKALGHSWNRNSLTYIYIHDRHIPDPSDTFAIGQSTPTASVTSLVRRNSMMMIAKPNNAGFKRLSALAIDIAGGRCPGSKLSPAGSKPPCLYLTEGFWQVPIEPNLDKCLKKRILKKYQTIFGYYNVKPRRKAIGVRKHVTYRLDIVDSCHGEILSYSPCRRQCDALLDMNVCIDDCELSGGSRCFDTCSQDVEAPFYCNSGVLESYFGFNPDLSDDSKGMGLQSEGTVETWVSNNRLRKQEAPTQIKTTDRLNWSRTTERVLIFRPYGDTSGGYAEQKIEGELEEEAGQSMVTPW